MNFDPPNMRLTDDQRNQLDERRRKEGQVECVNCKDWFPEEMIVTVTNGDRYCDPCYLWSTRGRPNEGDVVGRRALPVEAWATSEEGHR